MFWLGRAFNGARDTAVRRSRCFYFNARRAWFFKKNIYLCFVFVNGSAMQSDSVDINANVGLVRQILTLSLVPRENGTLCSNETALCEFSEMWYGVFLWAVVSSLVIHLPAGLLALFTLRHHKYGRFMPVSILLMSIIGPVLGGSLTSAAIAGVYRAAGKGMISLEALILGVGQSFCVLVISFLRILATL